MTDKQPDTKVPSATTATEPISETPVHEINTKVDLDSQAEIQRNFKAEILDKYVYPNDKEVLETLYQDKKFYENLLPITRGSKLFFSALLIPALSLSDARFPGFYLSYVAAMASFCIALFEGADLAIIRSNKKRLEKINAILESVGIKYHVPDTTLDDVTGKTESLQRAETAVIPISHPKPADQTTVTK